MNKLLKEAILWVFIFLPMLYLSMIWDQLPQSVPTHFGIDGQPNDWSDKTLLIYLPCLLGLGIYLLMLVIPRIDPKNKLAQMGDKFYRIRLILGVFICALSLYILYASKTGSITGTNFILILLGAFFAVLGNYMQAMRPNYFVGIRTPWTLENEEVWKNTHRLGGKLWMTGGLLIVLLALVIKDPAVLAIAFGIVIAVMVLVPVVYSYMEFKRIKGARDEGSNG
jgi:uncharacterized membrane protein